MPHFAEIDPQTNEVLQVILAKTKVWCEYHLGGTWVRTYKNTPGKKYAGKGYIYYPDRENFSEPQPYPSWTLDEQCQWHPPVARPEDENEYAWDEETQTWKAQSVWVTDEGGLLQPGDGLVASSIPGYFTKGEPILMKMSETCDFSESRTEVHYTANVVYIQSSHTANVTVNDEWDDIVVTPNGITYAQWSNLDANVQNTYTFIYASELEQDPQYATRIEEPAVTYAEWSNLDANTQNTYTLTYMQVNDVHYEKKLTSNVTESDPWDSIYIDPPNVSYAEYSNLEANVQNTYTLTYTMTVKTKATEAVYSNLSAEDKLYFTPVYTRTKNEIVTEGTQGAVKHTTIIPNEIKYLDASGTETDASNAAITTARVRCTFAAQ